MKILFKIWVNYRKTNIFKVFKIWGKFCWKNYKKFIKNLRLANDNVRNVLTKSWENLKNCFMSILMKLQKFWCFCYFSFAIFINLYNPLILILYGSKNSLVKILVKLFWKGDESDNEPFPSKWSQLILFLWGKGTVPFTDHICS